MNTNVDMIKLWEDFKKDCLNDMSPEEQQFAIDAYTFNMIMW